MSSRNVDIIIRARDEASEKIRQITGSQGGGGIMGAFGSLKSLVIGGGMVYGFSRAAGAVNDWLKELDQSEASVRRVNVALAASHQDVGIWSARLQEAAREIRALTTITDEHAQQLQAEALAQGIAADQVDQYTKSAIALTEAGVGISDASAAMRMLVLARQGDTSQLARHIVALKEANTQQEKEKILNEAVDRGWKNMRESTSSYTEAMEEMKQAFVDFRKELVEELGPALKDVFGDITNILKEFHEWTKASKEFSSEHPWLQWAANQGFLGIAGKMFLGGGDESKEVDTKKGAPGPQHVGESLIKAMRESSRATAHGNMLFESRYLHTVPGVEYAAANRTAKATEDIAKVLREALGVSKESFRRLNEIRDYLRGSEPAYIPVTEL